LPLRNKTTGLPNT